MTRKAVVNGRDDVLRLLIVDDEEAARYGMRRALASLNCELHEAGSVAEARCQLEGQDFELILLDVNLPGESGLDFLREIQAAVDPTAGSTAPLVIMITAHGSERMAVEVIKAGAHDYLPKPFEVDELRLVVKNALETIKLRQENNSLRRRIGQGIDAAESTLLGTSEAMRKVRLLIDKVAETDVTVLIRGESGTGKELVAREIHERSASRRKGAFIALNCAALPAELIESELFGHEKGAFTGAVARRQGKFEQAHGGTLFLDEIGDMSLGVQAKLLRALEERAIERLGGTGETTSVDVRILSATHQPLEEEILAGNFRPDLFYRLRVVTIEVPPLRERLEDVPQLIAAFIRAASERYRLPAKNIAPNALRRLLDYAWPGNVRELRNIIERAVVLAEGDEITARDLPDEITKSVSANGKQAPVEELNGLAVPFTADFREDRREFERRYIIRCLEDTNGNVTRAAAILGMHRQSLQHKLRELGLARRYVSASGAVSDNSDS